MHSLVIKILWTLIGLNTAALVIVAIAFLLSTNGRNVSTMESGWMVILFVVAIIVILLAAAPLHYGRSTFSLIVAGFFALLPLVVYLSVLVSNHLPKFGQAKTMAEFYYKDPAQQRIADAIEKGDTALVKELIKGQDLNIKGTPEKDGDSLSYLEFAIRLLSRREATFQEDANEAIIRILIAQGSATTPALSQGIRYLSPDIISVMLKAGGDPNTRSLVSGNPLLFDAIGTEKRRNDIAIQLIQAGALVNSKNAEGYTLLMFAANNARTSALWADSWRVIRYLIEEARADYTYKTPENVSFISIVKWIQQMAIEEKVTMPADFDAIVRMVENDPEQTSRNVSI